VLNLHERDRAIHIADVGTGSGCLAIALATEFPRARVTGTDLSGAALAVAARNVERHGVGDRVSLHEIDLLDGLGEFDVIVSNPPYVRLADAGSLMPEVIGFEPPLALFGGLDGLDLYRRLLTEGHRAIRSGGHLVLELGVAQLETVTTLAAGAGWQVARVYRDLQDIDRTLVLS
jgi:release factor glutamine methyltransferase